MSHTAATAISSAACIGRKYFVQIEEEIRERERDMRRLDNIMINYTVQNLLIIINYTIFQLFNVTRASSKNSIQSNCVSLEEDADAMPVMMQYSNNLCTEQNYLTKSKSKE